MVSEQHRTERGVAAASEADAAPTSFSQRRVLQPLVRATVDRAGTGAGGRLTIPAGAQLHLRSGAINLEGKGGVSVQAATFLEGVEPHIGAVYVKVAASEAPRDGIAPPLTLLSSGVVSTGNRRGMQVEELDEPVPPRPDGILSGGER